MLHAQLRPQLVSQRRCVASYRTFSGAFHFGKLREVDCSPHLYLHANLHIKKSNNGQKHLAKIVYDLNILQEQNRENRLRISSPFSRGRPWFTIYTTLVRYIRFVNNLLTTPVARVVKACSLNQHVWWKREKSLQLTTCLATYLSTPRQTQSKKRFNAYTSLLGFHTKVINITRNVSQILKTIASKPQHGMFLIV